MGRVLDRVVPVVMREALWSAPERERTWVPGDPVSWSVVRAVIGKYIALRSDVPALAAASTEVGDHVWRGEPYHVMWVCQVGLLLDRLERSDRDGYELVIRWHVASLARENHAAARREAIRMLRTAHRQSSVPAELSHEARIYADMRDEMRREANRIAKRRRYCAAMNWLATQLGILSKRNPAIVKFAYK